MKLLRSVAITDFHFSISHNFFNPFKSLLLSSSSTTSCELLSQFSPCSGWIWLEVGDKWKSTLLFLKQFHGNFCSKTTRFQEFKSFFRDAKWCFNMFNASWGLKGLLKFICTSLICYFCGEYLYPVWHWHKFKISLVTNANLGISYLYIFVYVLIFSNYLLIITASSNALHHHANVIIFQQTDATRWQTGFC